MKAVKPERHLCAWCSQFFDWTPPYPDADRPRYCKKTHKDAANRASRRFLTHFREGACPTPAKRAFDDASAVQQWMRAFPDAVGGARSYLCNCGKFHIGNVKRHVSAASPRTVRAGLPAPGPA